MSKGGLSLVEHKDLAKHINTLVYHSRMVDSLDEMLNETSDLSIYWSVCLSICLSVCLSVYLSVCLCRQTH